jgi:hypothetical protein
MSPVKPVSASTLLVFVLGLQHLYAYGNQMLSSKDSLLRCDVRGIVCQRVKDVRPIDGSTANVLRSPKSNESCGGALVVSKELYSFNRSKIFL